MNKHINTLYCLIIMLTVWCTWNSVKNTRFLSEITKYRVEVHLFEREVASLIDSLNIIKQRDVETTSDEVQD